MQTKKLLAGVGTLFEGGLYLIFEIKSGDSIRGWGCIRGGGFNRGSTVCVLSQGNQYYLYIK